MAGGHHSLPLASLFRAAAGEAEAVLLAANLPTDF